MKVSTSKFRTIVGREKSFGLRHKEVVLTFDDGPIAGVTSRILKTLSNECVKATFFYVGRMAKSQPRLVRKVISQGHTLGHHTHAHNRLVAYSSSQVEKHVTRGISTIEKIAYGKSGATPRVPFFRYPYLARNKRTDAVLRRKGLIAFDANIDSLDWKKVSGDAVHNRIMRRLRQEGKGIVLMHDIQKRTASMLPRLLRSLKREGYKIVHVVPSRNRAPVRDPIVVASLEKPEKVTLALPKNGIELSLRPVKSLPNNVTPPPVKNATSIEIPAIVASLSEDQLSKPRVKLRKKRKKLRKSRLKIVAGGNRISKRKKTRKTVRRKTRKSVKVASNSWKLRRSQWIMR